VLDALVQRNFAEKRVDLGSATGGEGDGPPPAVQELLEARASSMGEVTALDKMATTGAPLTPRRKEVSEILAKEILSRHMKGKHESKKKATVHPLSPLRKAQSAPPAVQGSSPGSMSLGKSMPIPRPQGGVVLVSGGKHGQAPIPGKGRNGSPMPPPDKSKKGVPSTSP